MADSSMADAEYEAELAEQRAKEQRRRQAMKETAQRKQQILSATPMPKWMKTADGVLDIVTAVSFVMTLITGGLDFIDAAVFFITGNGRILLSWFVKWYPMKRWKKIAVVIMDVIALMVILLVLGLISWAWNNPNEVCTTLGVATGNPILAALGLTGSCEVLQGVVQWVAH